MTIHYAILGLLSYQPMTGYDLKKRIQTSVFMHWSGNNNQIYKALLELLEAGSVTNEVTYQESLPPKKIYTITPNGLGALKKWVISPSELPECRRPFLIQMAWAGLLDNAELQDALMKYEEQVKMRLLMDQEKIRRKDGMIPRTDREALLWKMIDENILSSCRSELEWIQNFREQLLELRSEGE